MKHALRSWMLFTDRPFKQHKRLPVFIRGVLFVLCCAVPATSIAQDVVLAFDHTLAKSTSLDALARTKMLVNNMARANVAQAMFLIRTKDLNEKNSAQLDFLNQAGQFIVNAGDQYFPYLRQSNFAYPIDMMKANAILESYSQYKHHVYFPYLYEGDHPDISPRLESFLAEHDYWPTYITHTAQDDYLDHLYQQRVATNHFVDHRKLENAYASVLLDDVLAYDAKARLLLGFSPRQVILLHVNDVTAYCITAIIDALNAKSFKVVAPDNTFTDPIANPFFVSGFSAVSYLPYVTGLPEPKRKKIYIATPRDIEKIHAALQAQQLDSLIP